MKAFSETASRQFGRRARDCSDHGLDLVGHGDYGHFRCNTVGPANAAADKLVNTLRQARQQAITLRRNVLVTFTTPNRITVAVQNLPLETAATDNRSTNVWALTDRRTRPLERRS